MAGNVLVSSSQIGWLTVGATMRPVRRDVYAGTRCSAFLGCVNCFHSAGRSRRRRAGPGAGGSVAVRAERQSDGAGDGDLDISVFRFTLGIPGLDDSDLPRVLGILFGGLLVLNHAFSLSSMTAAQLRSEAVGLFLAALSISLPAINRQLNGGGGRSSSAGKPNEKQLFALADGLSDSRRQELAWASYTLLRNTDSTACLIWHSGRVVCVRGFWEIPDVDDLKSKSSALAWLDSKLLSNRFAELQEPLYKPNNADVRGLEIIPRGSACLLLQPFPNSTNTEWKGAGQGFLLVTSKTPQAYRRKDRLWIEAIAKKLSEVLPQ
ncbi:hypothetical protein MPTK1_7g17720 [Marchantia polymorpha subsp. ruderalis]|uniref:Protein COFACTOR ASSEMBLY OF COMPLEX C SUBUNIT B CCB2, chloroplastic n=2 Tax=Marchantia polymorpha TaxID=3197 RepID=A0AAF6C0V2_MARPO|nr:hypothetical protein MARPO_0051s0108 [Marchantia polymorpha]BBN17886.1 hypothetical protein Mp_7g17720 [Marchantia polymorpha subsp. ruderalis]|eukprot:PTQ38510.1 hypothetical protein MARPO_0051s0108 [Marchantia polymorpha]